MITWVLTFLVHSTLWCGLAWVALRLWPRAHARAREVIWTTAIVASLLTPLAHAWIPALWRVPLPALASATESEHFDAGEHDERIAAAGAAREHRPTERSPWLFVLAAGWIAIAAGMIAVQFVRRRALQRRIASRTDVGTSCATQALDVLSARARLSRPPRLTESDALGSPIAFGVGRAREICVPKRALRELEDDELTALLGHEVAHLLHRDVVRSAALHTVQAIFFVQPLFRLAVRELLFAAEERCDDWAADQSEDHLAMASCLTEVATWLTARDRETVVPCMARGPSHLKVRVRRLLDADEDRTGPSKVQSGLLAAGLLAFAAMLAPAVRANGEPEHARDAQRAERENHAVREHGRPEHSGPEHSEAKHTSGEHAGPGRAEHREHREHSETREHR